MKRRRYYLTILLILSLNVLAAQNRLTGYEYWFNSNFAGRHTEPLSPAVIHEFAAALEVSDLPDGVNVLHLRYKDEQGLYSATLSKLFFKAPPALSGGNKLTGYEYWFNSNFAGRHTETLSPAVSHKFTVALEVSDLPDGVNVFHLRYKDEQGLYSATLSKLFFKAKPALSGGNKLTAYKYWFDHAVSEATVVPLSPAVAAVELIQAIDLPADLPGGDHTFAIQFKDSTGMWSAPLVKTFLKEYAPTATLSADNNSTCSGTPVTFGAEAFDTDSIYWNFGDGSPVAGRTASQTVQHTYADAGTYTVTATLKQVASGKTGTATMEVTAYPAYGEATTQIIFDDFEEETTGTLPSGWVIKYNGTGDAHQKTVDNPVKNGNRSFQLEGTGGWAAQLYKTAANIPDKVTLEAWIQAEKILSGGAGGFGLANQNVGSWGSELSRIDFNNGNILFFYRQGSSIGPFFTLQSYVPGQWYHIKLEHDLIQRKCKVYIDGQLATGTNGSTTLTELPLEPTIEPKEVVLIAGNSATTKMFFDEVKLYEKSAAGSILPPVDLQICAGDIPYTFGSQQLTASGTYTETFQTIHGCDSVVNLNLTVNPVYSETQNLTLCQNELPYTFGTQSLTTAGVYTETFKTKADCDSTITLTLTVNPAFEKSQTVTICESGLPYAFGTQILEETGEYTETFQTIHGCDSVVNLSLTVNPVYNQTAELSLFEKDLPYLFGTQSLTAAGIYTEAFSSASGCDSTVTLTLTVLENADPVAVCNPVTIYLDETGNYTLSLADLKKIAEGSSDLQTSFADLTISVTPDQFSCQDADSEVEIRVVVTNAENYADTCYTTVSVFDKIPPQTKCRDTALYLDQNGEAILDVSALHPGAYDACGIAAITPLSKIYTCDDLQYTNNYLFTVVTDVHQNSTTCQNEIMLFDTIAPVFRPVANISVSPPAGKCKTTINYPEILATDNCTVTSLFLYEGLGPDGEFPVGITTERWVAVDFSGNSDTLSFEVIVSDNPVAPGINPIADIQIPEDTGWHPVVLTGIFDGSACKNYPLEFSLALENTHLIGSFLLEYSNGEEVATLRLLPAENAHGETRAVLSVTNTDTGLQHTAEFNLTVVPVNDPPYLVRPVKNMEMKAGGSMKEYFNPAKGVIFDDTDAEDILQLSLKLANGSALPGWLSFRNDSLVAFPTSAEVGCTELLLVATDPEGAEVSSHFSLCVSPDVGINTRENGSVKIYPNPTTGKIYLDFSTISGNIVDISVTNMLGQELFRKIHPGGNRLEIDLSGQVSGIYLLRVNGRDSGTGWIHKIILKRKN